MRFAYYQRLSAADRATYRASDRVTLLTVQGRTHLRRLLPSIRVSLAAGDQRGVQRALRVFACALCSALAIPAVRLMVLARRPQTAGSELHGLYEREDGKCAIIRVWMRTHRKKQPVAFRTFMRTFLHEICHHVDFEHLGLRDSFHTEGFFKRESSLARQLLPNVGTQTASKNKNPPRTSTQLELRLL